MGRSRDLSTALYFLFRLTQYLRQQKDSQGNGRKGVQVTEDEQSKEIAGRESE